MSTYYVETIKILGKVPEVEMSETSNAVLNLLLDERRQTLMFVE